MQFVFQLHHSKFFVQYSLFIFSFSSFQKGCSKDFFGIMKTQVDRLFL